MFMKEDLKSLKVVKYILFFHKNASHGLSN